MDAKFGIFATVAELGAHKELPHMTPLRSICMVVVRGSVAVDEMGGCTSPKGGEGAFAKKTLHFESSTFACGIGRNAILGRRVVASRLVLILF